jgi:hypothetical protein
MRLKSNFHLCISARNSTKNFSLINLESGWNRSKEFCDMSSQPKDPMLRRLIAVAQLLLKAQVNQQTTPPQAPSDKGTVKEKGEKSDGKQ